MEEKYKILIVDDEQSILDMLKLQLEFEGYSVYTAGNAAEALDKLSYSPDIVLLDINMDGMNGLDLCVSIRDFISCPIIFLTAKVITRQKVNFQKILLLIILIEVFISKGIKLNCQIKNLKLYNSCLLMQVRFLTEKKFMKIFGALTAMETALLSKSIYEKYV